MELILITGSGVHARQYVEALMFNKNYFLYVFPDDNKECLDTISDYGIDIIRFENLKDIFEKISLLIIANKPGKKKNIYELIKKFQYNGNILLEKPVALSRQELFEKEQCLNGNNYFVAYSRQFYKDSIKCHFSYLGLKTKQFVNWPNFYKFGIDLFKDTLPHVLDFILIVNNNNVPKIIRTNYIEGKQLEMEFDCFFGLVDINIYESDNDECYVTVNGEALEWPNYFFYINEMIECLKQEKKNDIDENNKMNHMISDMLFQIYEKNNLIFKEE